MAEKQAARLYRAVRMCSVVNSELKASDAIDEGLSAYNSKNKKSLKVEDFARLYFEDQSICGDSPLGATKAAGKSSVVYSPGTDKSSPEAAIASLCYQMDRRLGVYKAFGLSLSEAMEKFYSGLARVDAAQLYKRWYIGGGSIFGKDIPCTDIRLGGPSDLLADNRGFMSFDSPPDGWSPERYAAAKKKLATWDVDFEWTVAQHEVGARFAGENCKRETPGTDPNEVACRAEAMTKQQGPASRQNPPSSQKTAQ
jgi:hypothetical protein